MSGSGERHGIKAPDQEVSGDRTGICRSHPLDIFRIFSVANLLLVTGPGLFQPLKPLATANHGTDNVSVLVNRPACEYYAGDCNHNGVPLELADVVAMIGMYRGSAGPEYYCDCPPHGSEFPPEADPNGNCVPLELGDVVTEIGAYRGTTTASGCIDCPEQSGMLPGVDDKTTVIPSLKSRILKDQGKAAE